MGITATSTTLWSYPVAVAAILSDVPLVWIATTIETDVNVDSFSLFTWH